MLRSSFPFLFFIFPLFFLLFPSLSSCGPSVDLTIQIQNPKKEQFLRGWTTINVKITPLREVEEVLFAVRRLKTDDLMSYFKVLMRKQKPPFIFDWNTLKELDGTYELQIQVRLSDHSVQVKKISPLWILNSPAHLAFRECQHAPLIVNRKASLELLWLEKFPFKLPTEIEVFVQGRSQLKMKKPPYTFALDLSSYADGDEVYLSAVAVDGLFAGTTANCSLFIDRKAPKIRFIYPLNGHYVPRHFFAVLDIREEFGIRKVSVRADGQLTASLNRPPFQIPVDLSKYPHDSHIKLKAQAIDLAGNIGHSTKAIDVILDALPPNVEILYPLPQTAHRGDIDFQVRISDESGVGAVNFYLENEKHERLDNLLHTTGQGKTSSLFQAKISLAMALYGAGKRFFVVEAKDIHDNFTKKSISLILGCQYDADCPPQNPPYRCLKHRCIIPHKLGDLCDYEGSCEPPLICYKGGSSLCAKEKIGICRQPCIGGVCPKGFFCIKSQQGVAICFPGDACSPFAVNCPQGQQCVPWGEDSFVCLPTGRRGENSFCIPYSCSANNNCQRGLACVPATKGRGVCRRLCDQAFPNRDCGKAVCHPYPLRDKKKNSMGFCH